MKMKYVKKALASALAVVLVTSGINGMCVQAESGVKSEEAVNAETVGNEENAVNAETVSNEEKAVNAKTIDNQEKVETQAVQEVVAESNTEETAEASGTCGENATWTYADGVLTISGSGEVDWDTSDWQHLTPWCDYQKVIRKVVVTEGITGFRQKSAASVYFFNGPKLEAFDGMESLEEVSLPDTLIDMPCFRKCANLKEITIPDSISEIPLQCFRDCISLAKVAAKGVELIGRNAFEGCAQLEDEKGRIIVNHILCGINEEKCGADLVIPEGVTGVSYETLQFTGISSIVIPSTFQKEEYFNDAKLFYTSSIITELFGIRSLKKIEVAEGNPVYSSVDGCLLNKEKTKLLVCPKAKQGSYIIPKGVETIGYAALSKCAYLTDVKIPSSVKNVEYLGCATANYAPLYFAGDAVKPLATQNIDMAEEYTLRIFYDSWYDEEKEDTYYQDSLEKLTQQKIYYVEGTSGWDELRAEYPKIQNWLTWDGKGVWEEDGTNPNPGGTTDDVNPNPGGTTDDNTNGDISIPGTVATVAGQKTTEELTAAILSALNSCQTGAVISVEAASGCMLTQEVMQLVKEKGDKLIVNSDTDSGKVIWTFDKIENVVAFNPAVNIGTEIKTIADKMKNTPLDYVPVSFAHEGTLPGKASVYLDLSAYGKTFANGATLYLYYYNPSSGLFEKVSTATFDGTGAAFIMEHCSDYIVTNVELTQALTTSSANAPKTGDNSRYGMLNNFMIMLGAAIILVTYIKVPGKKKIEKVR